MSIVVTTKSEITVIEQIALGPSNSTRVTDSGINTTQLKLTESSPVSVKEKSHFAKALSGGGGTIDLLALVNTKGQTIASAGMRVQAIKVENPNATPLAVAPAGSNGYGLHFTVPPQGELLITSTNGVQAIGTSAHLLNIGGAGSDVSNWMIILG